LTPIRPAVCEHRPVYRPQDTLFCYTAWPTVCRDENGTLYASSSAFATDHVCPFTKAAMYVSRTDGKTWSPPIVLVDSYISDGNGAVVYAGNGRLVLDRSQSSKHPTHRGMLERRISMPEGKAHLEIYVDHSVIEIGGNDEWISSRVYPSREDALELTVRLENGAGSYVLSQMKDCEK